MKTRFLHIVLIFLLNSCAQNAEQSAPSTATDEDFVELEFIESASEEELEESTIAVGDDESPETEMNLVHARLSSEQLSAYDKRAKQKIADLEDYLTIVSDSSLNPELKANTEQLLKNLFISDTCVVLNPVRGVAEETMAEDKSNDFGNGGKAEISNDITSGFVPVSNRLYKKEISFSRGKAEVYLKRSRKSIGTDSIEVWEVKLGDIRY